jgi:hypothetical protein
LSTIVNRLRALIFSFVDKVNKDPLFVKYKESSLTFWDEIQENRQINWVQGSLIWEEEREKLSPYMYALTTLMTENYHDIVSGVIYRDTDDKHYKLFKETLITLTRISKTPYPF